MFIIILKEWLLSSPEYYLKEGRSGSLLQDQLLVGLTHVFQRNVDQKCVMAQNRATIDCWSFSDYVFK